MLTICVLFFLFGYFTSELLFYVWLQWVRVLVCGSIVVAAMDRKRGRHEAAFNFNGGAKKSRPGLSLLFTLFQLAISLLFSYMLSAITVPICFYFSMLLSPRQLLLLSSQSIDQEKRQAYISCSLLPIRHTVSIFHFQTIIS